MARTGTDADTDEIAASESLDPDIEPIGPIDDGEDEGDDPNRP